MKMLKFNIILFSVMLLLILLNNPAMSALRPDNTLNPCNQEKSLKSSEKYCSIYFFDTLRTVSERTNVSISKLISLNKNLIANVDPDKYLIYVVPGVSALRISEDKILVSEEKAKDADQGEKDNSVSPSVEGDSQPKFYVVKKGDTVWAIARKYNSTMADIKRINKLANAGKIYPGQKLWFTASQGKAEVAEIKSRKQVPAQSIAKKTQSKTREIRVAKKQNFLYTDTPIKYNRSTKNLDKRIPKPLYAAHTKIIRRYGRNYFWRLVGSIRRASEEHGVSCDKIVAVMHTESRFNSNAISKKGAKGLMQIMPVTFKKDLGGKGNIFDVDINVYYGTKYLARLLKRFNQDFRLVLAAYHYGPGRVEKLGRVPRWKPTQDYVKNVMFLVAES